MHGEKGLSNLMPGANGLSKLLDQAGQEKKAAALAENSEIVEDRQIIEPASGAGAHLGSHRRFWRGCSKSTEKREKLKSNLGDHYFGGKSQEGVYQTLINLMPPHSVFVEAYLGAGAIMRNKKPAQMNVGIDLDPVVISAWKDHELASKGKLKLIEGSAIPVLQNWLGFSPDTLVFCDPPYLAETRRSDQKRYNCEMLSKADHIELLKAILSLSCMVMICGYPSDLYEQFLSDWRTVDYFSTDRAGNRRLERVWLNFAETDELHDFRFLGANFREREKIRRKQKRLKAKLEKMPRLERLALFAVIDELRNK